MGTGTYVHHLKNPGMQLLQAQIQCHSKQRPVCNRGYGVTEVNGEGFECCPWLAPPVTSSTD